MAKGQFLTPYQQSIVNRYYQHLDTMTLQKLSELVSDLFTASKADLKLAERLWEMAARALAKTAANPDRVARIVTARNVTQLAELVNELVTAKPGTPSYAEPSSQPAAPSTSSALGGAPSTQPATPSAPAPLPPTATNPDGTPAAEVLKGALKAFKKRLKLTRLDEESRIGHGPLTTGARSGLVGIQPPSQFPQSVWDELVRQGKLKPAGRGFYSLVEGQ